MTRDGASFDGRRVVLAYDFAVLGNVSGCELGRVDEILLLDVTFLVRDGALAQGTAADPRIETERRELGSFAEWEGIAFDPSRDRSVLLRRNRRIPVWEADAVYFRDRRGIARFPRRTRRNPRDEIQSIEDLDALVEHIGGEVG